MVTELQRAQQRWQGGLYKWADNIRYLQCSAITMAKKHATVQPALVKVCLMENTSFPETLIICN